MNLSVSNIYIRLGEKPKKEILHNVSFDAHEGEFVSLLGASGAGKSTLLKIIAGILIQDEGTVEFGGKAVDGLPAYQRGVGFVFQDTRLFPHMNVEENVAFSCKMAKMPKQARIERAHYLLDCVHLADFGKREVATLSGGQAQRVALARALAANPRILLLDEPFSGLDESLRDDMRLLLLQLHRDFDITTVMVTHDAIESLEMSDRIVYVSEGRVIQEGTPVELYQSPASREIASCFGECSSVHGRVQNGMFQRGSLHFSAKGCPDGNAQAIVRYHGVKAREDEQASLRVLESVFSGKEYLVKLDIEGEVLTVPSSKDYKPGTRLGLEVLYEGCFVFPIEEA